MAKIAFYKGTDQNLFYRVLDFFVRFWTRGKYSHVELIDDRLSPDDPHTWMWYSASSIKEKCVRKKQVKFKEHHWDVYNLIDFDLEAAIELFDGEMGKPYDWVGIYLSQILPMKTHNPEKWFCSEIVAKALQAGKLINTNIKPSQVSPNNLHIYLEKLGFVRPATEWTKP